MCWTNIISASSNSVGWCLIRFRSRPIMLLMHSKTHPNNHWDKKKCLTAIKNSAKDDSRAEIGKICKSARGVENLTLRLKCNGCLQKKRNLHHQNSLMRHLCPCKNFKACGASWFGKNNPSYLHYNKTKRTTSTSGRTSGVNFGKKVQLYRPPCLFALQCKQQSYRCWRPIKAAYRVFSIKRLRRCSFQTWQGGPGVSLNQQFIWARHFLRKVYYSFFLVAVYTALKS